jgi:MATE family multidrug resistance protein
MELAALAFMVHLGLSNAITVRTAHFAGSDQPINLRRGAHVGIALSVGFGITMVVLFLTLPAPLIGLFLDEAKPGTAEITAFAITLLALAALFQMADAMQVIALGLLRGIQDTRVPMVMAAVSYWLIGIPSSYVLAFPLGLGGVGLWLGLVIGLICAAALLMARFWMRASR